MGYRQKVFIVSLAFIIISYVNFMSPFLFSPARPDSETLGAMQRLLDKKYKKNETSSDILSVLESYLNGYIIKQNFKRMDLLRNFAIVANGSDVIIFLRIQKSGSTTLTKHLTKAIDVSRWCRCVNETLPQCDCFNRWISNVMFLIDPLHFPCGVHADWTRLHECAERNINSRHRSTLKQRHMYMTMVRDPYFRFVSEWKHVFRGATWKKAPLICNNVSATKAEVPSCYDTPTWTHVTLQEFMDCPSNLATNRQTRMLSDLTLVNCYNSSGMTFEERHLKMLASAKENLKNMAFFGLTEYQELSQILFENTFNLTFIDRFDSTPLQKTYGGGAEIDEEERTRIIHLNRFDVMLYQFAKDLFFQRLNTLAKTTDKIHIRQKLMKFIRSVMGQYKRMPLNR